MSLHPFRGGSPPFDGAPPTDAERAWWVEERRPFRRRALLMGIPWGFGVVVMPPLLAAPAAFLAGGWMVALPVAAVGGLLFGQLMWHSQAKLMFQSQLAGRRVRERLRGGDEAVPHAADGTSRG